MPSDPVVERPTDEAAEDDVRRLLDERYGRTGRRRRRRTLIAATTVVSVLFGSWLTWTASVQSRPLVASADLVFDVVDDNTAVARFQIETRNDDVDPRCTLRAYAEDHAIVGQLSFSPGAGVNGRLEQALNTERRATAVELVGCTAEGQTRPR